MRAPREKVDIHRFAPVQQGQLKPQPTPGELPVARCLGQIPRDFVALGVRNQVVEATNRGQIALILQVLLDTRQLLPRVDHLKCFQFIEDGGAEVGKVAVTEVAVEDAQQQEYRSTERSDIFGDIAKREALDDVEELHARLAIAQAIAGTAHGRQQLRREIPVDFLAQARYMHIDHIGLRVEMVAPDMLE